MHDDLSLRCFHILINYIHGQGCTTVQVMLRMQGDCIRTINIAYIHTTESVI